MRHKYRTRALVLARSPLGEMSAQVLLLTEDFGVVRARAQGVRRAGAKLAAALATLTESSLTLVRGQEGWRVTGAVLEENWCATLSHEARERAARVCGLVLRMSGEGERAALLPLVRAFFHSLTQTHREMHEAAEVLAALRALSFLGLDAGEIPGGATSFAEKALAEVVRNRSRYIVRINTGLAASGL